MTTTSWQDERYKTASSSSLKKVLGDMTWFLEDEDRAIKKTGDPSYLGSAANKADNKEFDKVMKKHLDRNFDYMNYLVTGGGGSTEQMIIKALEAKGVDLAKVESDLKKTKLYKKAK